MWFKCVVIALLLAPVMLGVLFTTVGQGFGLVAAYGLAARVRRLTASRCARPAGAVAGHGSRAGLRHPGDAHESHRW